MLALPLIFAVFLWWFSTVTIMAVYGRSPLLMRLAFAGSTLGALVALVVLIALRDSTDMLAVYASVTCGVVIWGWLVSGYYLGFVTGPRPLPEKIVWHHSLAVRFRVALSSLIYHELLALACAIVLAVATWNYPNRWGLWIYLAMWIMHSSAKLNVFLGVRNFRLDLLPNEFQHLDNLLSRRTSNIYFPVSIVVSSGVALVMFYRALTPGITAETEVGLILVATMIALGILEHALLMLPLPATLLNRVVRSFTKRGKGDSQADLHNNAGHLPAGD